MKVGNRDISISSRDKLFFPENEITKGDVIDYYSDVSDLILPFLKNRPVMVQRFPNGIDKDGFYQKSISDYFPDWMNHQKVKKEDGEIDHIICNDKASLIYLVNQGTITFHNWLSKVDDLNKPDQMIIDLDPPKGDFDIVREGALKIREFLDEINVTSFVQTTGSEGLHIFIMLDGKETFDTVRGITKQMGESLCLKHPEIFTLAQRKDKREGKLFFDIHAIAYGQTNVTPYSIRPLKKAPIATPLDWYEIRDKSLKPQSYHIKNIKNRLAQKKNPWEGMKRHAISIKSLKDKMS